MAPRANWKGYLKLSLVSCAVNLYPASSSSSRVSFNTINRKTGNRVKRQFVDAVTGEVVDTPDQAKGYEVDKNTFMLIEDEELDAVQIESTHTIDIEKFVPRAEVDSRYLDAPYYLAPNERVAEEAFSIIRQAMLDEKVVGLGRVVIARRERIVMLEPLGKGMLGTVLRYAYEVRGADAYFEDIPDVQLPGEMLDLAHVIIQRKAGHFDPEQFADRYEDAVVAMIRAKQAGQPARPQEPARASNVIDIMEALRKSIAVEGGAPSKAGKAAEQAEVAAPSPKPKAPSKSRKPAAEKAPAAKAPVKVRKAR
jgi:DNA end-binding protein Ku